MWCVLSIGIAIVTGNAIAQSKTETNPKEKAMTILVTATVLEYLPEAMRDTFEDGSSKAFDGTKVRITSGPVCRTGSRFLSRRSGRGEKPLESQGEADPLHDRCQASGG